MSIETQQLWNRDGLVLARRATGLGSEVVGDPCIVWDDEQSSWRMFLFFEPPGHASALATNPHPGPADWSEPVPLPFTNPELMEGGTHKPFVVMDARRPNSAALVDGKYWLVTVSHDGAARDKFVQRAWSTSLAGPWTLEEVSLIARGGRGEFDEKHVDAVSGFWFDDLGQFFYYYMGYPEVPQPNQSSPLGSSIGLATQRPGEAAVKQGVVIQPTSVEGHWASGWLGGLQIFPGTTHAWVGMLNASPTSPDGRGTLTSEEPAPSLGGFAFTDADVPIEGWTIADAPIEWIDDIPEAAVKDGEGTNLWRQHVLILGDTVRVYYNSGFYGQEQLYSKSAPRDALGIA